MSLDITQPGIAAILALVPQTGTNPGQVPTVPVPMTSMSNPVKTCLDAITAQVTAGNYAGYFGSLATQSYVASQIAILTAGSPAQMNTFLEAYNQFLTDESAASATNAAIASEATTRAAADTALTAAVAAKQAAGNLNTATLDFGYASGNEGDVTTTTVAASWVTATSRIFCLPSPADSPDHSTEETLVEDIRFTAVNIIPSTSFDVEAVAPNGTWGRHNCSIISL